MSITDKDNEGWEHGAAGDLSHLDPDRPRQNPPMSRIVPKAACPDPNNLAEWLREETGGYVTMVGEPMDLGLNWQLFVSSPDGKPHSAV